MGTVLDIAIGLAFVFALVALICTGLQEWVSGMMNLRGKTLWEGIQSMLLADAAKATDPGQALDKGAAVESHLVGICDRLKDLRFKPLDAAVPEERVRPFRFWRIDQDGPGTEIGHGHRLPPALAALDAGRHRPWL